MSAFRGTSLAIVFALICGNGRIWPQSVPQVNDWEDAPKAAAGAHQRSQAVQPKALSTKQIVEPASRALVLITTHNAEGQTIAQGSGFFVSHNLVATNLHVLKWASQAGAKFLADGVEYPVEHVLGFDLANDLCLLEVEAAAAVPLPLGNTTKTAVGEDIIVAGNPEGLEGSFSKGIISALRNAPDRLQISAAISPGSSGGPVLNMHGEVIGIATSSLASGQNLNFAVPAHLLWLLINRPLVVPEGFQFDAWLSVRTAGSLSVTDRERDGLIGPVRKVVLKRADYNYDPPLDRYRRGDEVIQQATTYNPQGRVIVEETFKDGWIHSKTTYEYNSDGLLARFVSTGPEGRKEEHPFSTEEALGNAELRVPFSTERTYGSPASSDGRHMKYDGRGNVTEFTQGTKVVRRRFENQREVESEMWYMSVLKFKTRSTYEDDAFGNWVARHETMLLPDPKFAQFGYQPSDDEVRQIDYY